MRRKIVITGLSLLVLLSAGWVLHVHTIYRDPTNDYGARLVRR